MVQSQQTVLFVLTSTKTMGAGGKPTGAWLEEFTVPYYAIRDAGLLPISRRPKGAPCRSVEEVRVGTSPGKSAAILHLTTADNVPLAVEIPVAISWLASTLVVEFSGRSAV